MLLQIENSKKISAEGGVSTLQRTIFDLQNLSLQSLEELCPTVRSHAVLALGKICLQVSLLKFEIVEISSINVRYELCCHEPVKLCMDSVLQRPFSVNLLFYFSEFQFIHRI